MGKTIIISSHILPDIEEISDQIGILEAGKLVLDGDLETLRNHYGTSQRVIKLRVSAAETPLVAERLRQLPGVNSCVQRE
jgi:ABC-2 type transport system ATP-binding protein